MSVTLKELKEFLDYVVGEDDTAELYIYEGVLTLCHENGYLEIGGKPIEKEVFIFTFGVGHPYKGYYVEILADDRSSAEELMTEAHGDQWADSRAEKDGRRVIREYGYTLLATIGDHED